jgi:hypothetical protein
VEKERLDTCIHACRHAFMVGFVAQFMTEVGLPFTRLEPGGVARDKSA